MPSGDLGAQPQPFIAAIAFNICLSSVWPVCLVSLVCIILTGVTLIGLAPPLKNVLAMKNVVDLQQQGNTWFQDLVENLVEEKHLVRSGLAVHKHCGQVSDNFWTTEGFPANPLRRMKESLQGITLSADICTLEFSGLSGVNPGMDSALKDGKQIHLESVLQPMPFLED
jgi:hypothetical protein